MKLLIAHTPRSNGSRIGGNCSSVVTKAKAGYSSWSNNWQLLSIFPQKFLMTDGWESQDSWLKHSSWLKTYLSMQKKVEQNKSPLSKNAITPSTTLCTSLEVGLIYLMEVRQKTIVLICSLFYKLSDIYRLALILDSNILFVMPLTVCYWWIDPDDFRRHEELSTA